jgi:hypothetical protein
LRTEAGFRPRFSPSKCGEVRRERYQIRYQVSALSAHLKAGIDPLFTMRCERQPVATLRSCARPSTKPLCPAGSGPVYKRTARDIESEAAIAKVACSLNTLPPRTL